MKSNELSDLYKIRFPQKILLRKNAIWKVICNNFLQKYISKDANVVDIACGYGEFLNNIVAARKVAIDLNPDAKQFLSKEVEFHLLRATELSSVLSLEADVIFTSNFLEHLPDKSSLDEFWMK